MTIDELKSLREVPVPFGCVWREDADPFGFIDENDKEWMVFRDRGNELVRALRGATSMLDWRQSLFNRKV